MPVYKSNGDYDGRASLQKIRQQVAREQERAKDALPAKAAKRSREELEENKDTAVDRLNNKENIDPETGEAARPAKMRKTQAKVRMIEVKPKASSPFISKGFRPNFQYNPPTAVNAEAVGSIKALKSQEQPKKVKCYPPWDVTKSMNPAPPCGASNINATGASSKATSSDVDKAKAKPKKPATKRPPPVRIIESDSESEDDSEVIAQLDAEAKARADARAAERAEPGQCESESELASPPPKGVAIYLNRKGNGQRQRQPGKKPQGIVKSKVQSKDRVGRAVSKKASEEVEQQDDEKRTGEAADTADGKDKGQAGNETAVESAKQTPETSTKSRSQTKSTGKSSSTSHPAAAQPNGISKTKAAPKEVKSRARKVQVALTREEASKQRSEKQKGRETKKAADEIRRQKPLSREAEENFRALSNAMSTERPPKKTPTSSDASDKFTSSPAKNDKPNPPSPAKEPTQDVQRVKTPPPVNGLYDPESLSLQASQRLAEREKAFEEANKITNPIERDRLKWQAHQRMLNRETTWQEIVHRKIAEGNHIDRVRTNGGEVDWKF